MCEITVVNKHKLTAEQQREAHYIGRGSPLGNPFKVKPWGPHERGATLELYRGWLDERIDAGDPRVVRELERIAAEAKRDGGVRIMCFCKPKACHGDVIKQVVEARFL